MDRKAQRRLIKFILALEQAIAEAEAAPVVNPREVALMQHDLADLRRFASRLGADMSSASPSPARR